MGCEEPREELPRAEHVPNIPREPAPRFPQTVEASESMPVRTKVVSNGPSNTITLGEFRGSGGGGGGGGGGDRVRGRPPGFPRGMRQEPEDQYAASREAIGQQRRRGSEACQLAFEAARDLQQARQTKTTGRRRTSIDRDDFIETCERRPEIEQWCLVPSYVMQNSADCDRRAHTRYARAIERYENRAEGEADDWAPTETPPEANAEAETPEAPTMGPVRVPRPEQ